MNADADLIRDEMGPEVKEVFPRGNYLWQDDPATIHWAAVAIEAVGETFASCLPAEDQAPKHVEI